MNKTEKWVEENPLRASLAAEATRAKTSLTNVLQGVAESIGVSRQTMFNWLNGDTMPDSRNLVKIADRADFSVDEYVHWWEQRPHRRTASPGPRGRRKC